MVILTLAVPLYGNIHYCIGEIGIAISPDSELTTLLEQVELLGFFHSPAIIMLTVAVSLYEIACIH